MRRLVRITAVDRADPSHVSYDFETVSDDQDFIELWLAYQKAHPDGRRYPEDLREGDEFVMDILPDSSST